MKRLLYIICLLSAVCAGAQDKPKVSFAYDVDFEFRFDNREFARSAFTPSMTIFGARLTPQAGLAVTQKDGTAHRLMIGVDVMKDFGAAPVSELLAGGKTDETASALNNLGLFREITLYYNLRRKIARTDMELYAGIFPRRNMQG